MMDAQIKWKIFIWSELCKLWCNVKYSNSLDRDRVKIKTIIIYENSIRNTRVSLHNRIHQILS